MTPLREIFRTRILLKSQNSRSAIVFKMPFKYNELSYALLCTGYQGGNLTYLTERLKLLQALETRLHQRSTRKGITGLTLIHEYLVRKTRHTCGLFLKA